MYSGSVRLNGNDDLNVDVIFGGLGIELLPDISDTIDKTFVTFKELNNLV